MSSFSDTCVSLRSARASRVIVAAVFAAVAAACGSNAPTAPSMTASGAPVTTTTSGGGAVGTAAGSTAGATYVPGGGGTNYTCSDLAAQYAPGAEWFEIKYDGAPSGSHDLGDGMLAVRIANGSKQSFDWTSNVPVDVVFVKSGSQGHNLYLYASESKGANALTTPTGQDISHITFCYDVELLVEKTVSTTFKRDFDWTITKTVDQPLVSIAAGGQAVVNYTVAATKDAGTDSDWAVAGTIKVTNPHTTLTASGVSLADSLSDYGNIVVSCPAATLAPLASMTCNYGAVALANGNNRTNTGIADSSTYGIVKGEGSTGVAFVTPTTVFDNAVNVTDSYSGAGTLASGLTASRTFPYARTIASTALACGANTIGNTASLSTDDGVTRTASANVIATLTCTATNEPVLPPPPPVETTTGCTLSQGYWGSHSSKGPASKYDAAWAAFEDKPFYQSGMTYYEQMQAPSKGNAYNVLAVQFIAATLNMVKGAKAPAGVDMNAVDAFYKKYTPAQIDKLKGSDPVRKQALDWAGTLDSYNNGRLNAPYCGK